jgi:hypothetical protein
MPLTLYPRRGRDISGADNHIANFYDIHGRKGEALFFLSWTPHETRDNYVPIYSGLEDG